MNKHPFFHVLVNNSIVAFLDSLSGRWKVVHYYFNLNFYNYGRRWTLIYLLAIVFYFLKIAYLCPLSILYWMIYSFLIHFIRIVYLLNWFFFWHLYWRNFLHYILIFKLYFLPIQAFIILMWSQLSTFSFIISKCLMPYLYSTQDILWWYISKGFLLNIANSIKIIY